MREHLTNAGKKEQRQFNQVLNKAVRQGRMDQLKQVKDIEARTVPKSHNLKKRRGK
jgi:hypothetical protein